MSEIYSARGSPLVEVGADDSPPRNNALTVLATDHASIEIPAEINSLHRQEPGTALSWREDTRWAFTESINAGYALAGFVRETREKQPLRKYLLKKNLNEFECRSL